MDLMKRLNRINKLGKQMKMSQASISHHNEVILEACNRPRNQFNDRIIADVTIDKIKAMKELTKATNELERIHKGEKTW